MISWFAWLHFDEHNNTIAFCPFGLVSYWNTEIIITLASISHPADNWKTVTSWISNVLLLASRVLQSISCPPVQQMNKIRHDFAIKQQQPVEVIHVAPHNPPSTRGHPTTISWLPGHQARIKWAEQGSKTAWRGRGSRSGHKQESEHKQADHSRTFCCRALAVKWRGSYVETKPKSMQMHLLSRVIVMTATYSVLCIVTLHDASSHNTNLVSGQSLPMASPSSPTSHQTKQTVGEQLRRIGGGCYLEKALVQ